MARQTTDNAAALPKVLRAGLGRSSAVYAFPSADVAVQLRSALLGTHLTESPRGDLAWHLEAGPVSKIAPGMSGSSR